MVGTAGHSKTCLIMAMTRCCKHAISVLVRVLTASKMRQQTDWKGEFTAALAGQGVMLSSGPPMLMSAWGLQLPVERMRNLGIFGHMFANGGSSVLVGGTNKDIPNCLQDFGSMFRWTVVSLFSIARLAMAEMQCCRMGVALHCTSDQPCPTCMLWNCILKHWSCPAYPCPASCRFCTSAASPGCPDQTYAQRMLFDRLTINEPHIGH